MEPHTGPWKKNLVPAWYEIRVAGQLDETASDAFAGLDVTDRDGVTVIRGEVDQAGLNGLLERIRSLQLDLVDVRRVRRAPVRRPIEDPEVDRSKEAL
jgi:hypothetical protein